MNKLIIFVLVVLLLGALYWYGSRSGWFVDTSPTNLPTQEELQRINEIDQSSSQIAPDARAGAGVVPPGSAPPTEAPEPTTTAEETVDEVE